MKPTNKQSQQLSKLLQKWDKLRTRNEMRSAYYAGEERFRSYGIGLPPKMAAQAKSVIGWPSKTVDMLADLTAFRGYEAVDDTDTATQDWLDDLVHRSKLTTTVSQAVVSAYTHGCSFLTVAGGADGRPTIIPRSALWSVGVWDSVSQWLSAVMTIDAVQSDTSTPTQVRIHERGKSTVFVQGAMGWDATEYTHAPMMLTAYPIVCNPSLDRPLGVARLDRQVMGLTMAAWRTVMRMECTAEYYSSPHLWLVGTAEDFDPGSGANRWSALQNAINSITKDDQGHTPTLQQIAQATMTPHADMIKSLALLLSADTDIPPEALGIDRSNPTSADALAAMERRLSRKADRQNILFATSLEQAARDAAAIEGVELGAFRATFEPTRETSLAARVDAFSKLAGTTPAYVQTREAWTSLGYSSDEANQIVRRVRAADTTQALSSLFGGNADPATPHIEQE